MPESETEPKLEPEAKAQSEGQPGSDGAAGLKAAASGARSQREPKREPLARKVRWFKICTVKFQYFGYEVPLAKPH